MKIKGEKGKARRIISKTTKGRGRGRREERSVDEVWLNDEMVEKRPDNSQQA